MSKLIGSGDTEYPATLDDVPDGPSETPETANKIELKETQKSLREAQDKINHLNKYYENTYGAERIHRCTVTKGVNANARKQSNVCQATAWRSSADI